MPDIRVIPITTPVLLTFDWLQTPAGLLDETQALADAITVALNTDATADINEVLPDPRSDNRRGWWGDLDADKIWGGWPIGSKLWLLSRTKILDSTAREGSTVARAEAYCRAALKPFVDNGICSRIMVNAAQTSIQRIDATIVAYRGPKSTIALEFQPLWQEVFPPGINV